MFNRIWKRPSVMWLTLDQHMMKRKREKNLYEAELLRQGIQLSDIFISTLSANNRKSLSSRKNSALPSLKFTTDLMRLSRGSRVTSSLQRDSLRSQLSFVHQHVHQDESFGTGGNFSCSLSLHKWHQGENGSQTKVEGPEMWPLAVTMSLHSVRICCFSQLDHCKLVFMPKLTHNNCFVNKIVVVSEEIMKLMSIAWVSGGGGGGGP